MKDKIVYVEITKVFDVNPNRPRPKWWDKFVGEKFACYDACEGWWKLSKSGLNKLNSLRGGKNKSISAIIYKGYGVEVEK